MKLTGVCILRWNGQEATPVFLGSAIDVSNFGYFQVRAGGPGGGWRPLQRKGRAAGAAGQRRSQRARAQCAHDHGNGVHAVVFG